MSKLTDAAKAASDLAASLTALDPLQTSASEADAALKVAADDAAAKTTALDKALQAAGVTSLPA